MKLLTRAVRQKVKYCKCFTKRYVLLLIGKAPNLLHHPFFRTSWLVRLPAA